MTTFSTTAMMMTMMMTTMMMMAVNGPIHIILVILQVLINNINDHLQEFATENSSDTADRKNENTNNNDLSDDDDKKDYNDNDDDVDCLPWQDKQLVLSQDLSLTVPITTDAVPSLIESPTDKSTDTKNNNNICTTPKQTKTIHIPRIWTKANPCMEWRALPEGYKLCTCTANTKHLSEI